MLSVQLVDMAIRGHYLHQQIQTIEQSDDQSTEVEPARLLEFTYQLPIFALCGYLYLTFRHCFSKGSSRNLVLIAWLMTGMDILTTTVRFFAAFK